MRRGYRIEIQSMERPATFLVQIGFFALMGGLAAAFSIPWRRGEGWGWGIAVVVLGLFALLQLGIVVRMLASHMRFGRVHLYLEQHPELGRDLKARLLLPPGIDTSGFVTATLESHSVTWNNSDDTGQDVCEWSTERKFPLTRNGRAAVADIELPIPAGRSATTMPASIAKIRAMGMLAQPANVTRGQAYYDWMLKVHVEAPGPDLERTYFVPVRPTL